MADGGADGTPRKGHPQRSERREEVPPPRDHRRASFSRSSQEDKLVPLKPDKVICEAVDLLNELGKDANHLPLRSRAPLPPVASAGSTESAEGLDELPTTGGQVGPLGRAYTSTVQMASMKWESRKNSKVSADDEDDDEKWKALERRRAEMEAKLVRAAESLRSEEPNRRLSLPDGRLIHDYYNEAEREIRNELGSDDDEGDHENASPEEDDDDDTGEDSHVGALRLENNLLKEKLVAEKARLQQAKDKVYFLLVKLKSRDEQLFSLKETLRGNSKRLQEYEEKIADLQNSKDQLERKVESMQAQQIQLEFEKYKLQSTVQKAAEEDETYHVRGVQKAKMLLAHQLFKQQADKQIATLKADLKHQRKLMRLKLQKLEQNCMEFEDEYSADTLHSLINTLRYGKFQHQQQIRRNIARDLCFKERPTLKAPDDEHVKAVIAKSYFSGLLPQCKEELGETVKELKELSDRTLQSVWYLFNEKTQDRNGKKKPVHKIYEDFHRAIEQALIRGKQLVADFGRKCNAYVRALVSREKEVIEEIRATRFSTVSVECEADFRPPTPREVYDLREEVQLHQRRLRSLGQEFAEKENTLEMRASKAESNVEFLQRHILTLHRALFSTLHIVYKHRFRWIPRLPDPIRTLRIPEAKDRKKALEVSYNMKLGELLQADTEYMERFGHYMISEDFGTGGVVIGSDQAAMGRRKSLERRASDAGAGRERDEREGLSPPCDPADQSKPPRAPGSQGPGGGAVRSKRLSKDESWTPRQEAAAAPITCEEGDVLSPQDSTRLPSFAKPIGNIKKEKMPEGKQWPGVLEEAAHRGSTVTSAPINTRPRFPPKTSRPTPPKNAFCSPHEDVLDSATNKGRPVVHQRRHSVS